MNLKTHAKFEKIFMPHLDAAYGLARWISHAPIIAEDIVQAAYVRAWEYFDRYENRNSSAWFLTIVRNVAYTMLAKRNKDNNLVSFDELVHHAEPADQFTASIVPGLISDNRYSPKFLVNFMQAKNSFACPTFLVYFILCLYIQRGPYKIEIRNFQFINIMGVSV